MSNPVSFFFQIMFKINSLLLFKITFSFLLELRLLFISFVELYSAERNCRIDKMISNWILNLLGKFKTLCSLLRKNLLPHFLFWGSLKLNWKSHYPWILFCLVVYNKNADQKCLCSRFCSCLHNSVSRMSYFSDMFKYISWIDSIVSH